MFFVATFGVNDRPIYMALCCQLVWGGGLILYPGRVFVMAAEFLNITEKTGMVNLTVRFSVIKSW